MKATENETKLNGWMKETTSRLGVGEKKQGQWICTENTKGCNPPRYLPQKPRGSYIEACSDRQQCRDGANEAEDYPVHGDVVEYFCNAETVMEQ